jgi:hypothetical protein
VDDDYGNKSKRGISGYAALSMIDDTGAAPAVEEEEEDFGGLMVLIYHQSHDVVFNMFLGCDQINVKGEEGEEESEERCN